MPGLMPPLVFASVGRREQRGFPTLAVAPRQDVTPYVICGLKEFLENSYPRQKRADAKGRIQTCTRCGNLKSVTAGSNEPSAQEPSTLVPTQEVLLFYADQNGSA
jgi:hypothetical protein